MAEVFGERWPALLSAMQQPPTYVCLINPWAKQTIEMSGERLEPPLWTGACRVMVAAQGATRAFPSPHKTGLHTHYLLDMGSILAVEALRPECSEANTTRPWRVLDMCAAPGGKSLGILFRMQGRQFVLHANDIDAKRRARLSSVLDSYLPPEIRSMVSVNVAMGEYDRILVDVPCSAERHALAQNRRLQPFRSKKDQCALLWDGLCRLSPNGRLVYSTCSISPLENDSVVQQTLDRLATYRDVRSADPFSLADVHLVRRSFPFGEPTSLGWIVLPDSPPPSTLPGLTGSGPLYFAIFVKNNQKTRHNSSQCQ